MSVILREQENKSGSISYYLDINYKGRRREFYQGGNVKPNMKPKDKRNLISEVNAWAEKRAYEIRNSINDMPVNYAEHTLVRDYTTLVIDRYKKADIRKLKAAVTAFLSYTGNNIRFNEISETKIQAWLDEMTHNGLASDTVKGYYKKIRAILIQANDEKITKFNISQAKRIKPPKVIHKTKEILSIAELQTLANAACTDERVKYAFIFSCYTGLDFSDIYNFKPEHILNGYLVKRRGKTNMGGDEPLFIHPTANVALSKAIGHVTYHNKKTVGYLFDLPGRVMVLNTCYNYCSDILKDWVSAAGIKKNITWHCARHSFGTNMRADTRIKAHLLRHAEGSKMTDKYNHVLDERVTEAVLSLEEINI